MKTLVLLGLAVSACGASPKDNKTSGQGSEPTDSPESSSRRALMVADASQLPPCTAAEEGWIVYVKAESAIQACVSGAWEIAQVKGEKGEKGDAGEKGEKGDVGPEGGDETIASSIACSGTAATATVGDPNLKFLYEVKIMSGGSAFATASLLSASASYSNSDYYAESETGLNEAAVRVSYGGTAHDYFTLALNRTTGVFYIRKFSFGGTLDGNYPITFQQSDKCMVTNF